MVLARPTSEAAQIRLIRNPGRGSTPCRAHCTWDYDGGEGLPEEGVHRGHRHLAGLGARHPGGVMGWTEPYLFILSALS